MKPLMPDYERQLRAAARRLINGPGRAAPSAPPARGGLGSRLLVAVTGTVVVVVALGAVLLLGRQGTSPVTGPGAPLPAVQYDCAPHQILRARGRLEPIAHGTVGGQGWTLEADSGRHGFRSVQAGRFVLGSRAYGFCQTGLDIELVNAGAHGIVYGLAARLYGAPIVIQAGAGHGTAAHPVRARKFPATMRPVPGGTLFLRVLPASACAYRGIGVTAPQRVSSGPPGSGQLILAFTGPYSGGCQPGALLQTPQTPKTGSGPSTPQISAPAALSAQQRAVFNAGRRAVGQAGCLACHQIGAQGNNGPGPVLTHIGRNLSARAIASTLVHPVAPMPSYHSLPARTRRAIVAFLRDLR